MRRRTWLVSGALLACGMGAARAASAFEGTGTWLATGARPTTARASASSWRATRAAALRARYTIDLLNFYGAGLPPLEPAPTAAGACRRTTSGPARRRHAAGDRPDRRRARDATRRRAARAARAPASAARPRPALDGPAGRRDLRERRRARRPRVRRQHRRRDVRGGHARRRRGLEPRRRPADPRRGDRHRRRGVLRLRQRLAVRLDRASGKEVWRYDLGDARVARVLPNPTSSITTTSRRARCCADGVLYVGAGDGSLHAVDAAGGTRLWRFAGPGKVRASAAVPATAVVFGTLGGRSTQLDRVSGLERWRWQDQRAGHQHAGVQPASTSSSAIAAAG